MSQSKQGYIVQWKQKDTKEKCSTIGDSWSFLEKFDSSSRAENRAGFLSAESPHLIYRVRIMDMTGSIQK